MSYSLAAKFLSELIGMTWVIYTGEAVLANELLPNTKGHDMGWFAVAFGFGMQFFPPIFFLGSISATLNPAFALTLFVLGDITIVECIVLSAGTFTGAFLGAVLHWLHFLPHYKTIPEPPLSNRAQDTLIERRDVQGPTSLRFSSHVSKRKRKTGNLNAIKELKYYTTNKNLIEDYYSQGHLPSLERHSVQVGDLHEFLRKKYATNEKRDMCDVETLGENENDTHTKELYEAAVRADQAVKLSIFATRPAIYAPLFNFACEAMGTTAFLFGVTLLVMQTSMLPSPVDVVYQKCILPFVLGFFIVICVVGLGGPTGFSANPARDFSPRLAHFLLPIVGKGCSEWRYAWIAFLGPYVGGAMAGGLGIAMKYLYNSGGTAYFSVPR